MFVAHTCNPSTEELEHKDHKLKACLDFYTYTTMPAPLKNKQQTPKKTKKKNEGYINRYLSHFIGCFYLKTRAKKLGEKTEVGRLEKVLKSRNYTMWRPCCRELDELLDKKKAKDESGQVCQVRILKDFFCFLF